MAEASGRGGPLSDVLVKPPGAGPSHFNLKIWSNGQIHLDAGPKHSSDITEDFLEKSVSGFVRGKRAVICITFDARAIKLYRECLGKSTWSPSVPPGLNALPKGPCKASFKIATVNDFIGQIGEISMTNSFRFKWMPFWTKITGWHLTRDLLKAQVVQKAENIEASKFEVEAEIAGGLQINRTGAYLEFRVSDIFGGSRSLRLYHRGYGEGWICLKGSVGYERVVSMSFDGVKLRIIAAAGREFSAATLYKEDPAELYEFGGDLTESDSFLVRGSTKAYLIEAVGVRGRIEREMVRSAMNTYAHGRIGAEIAYAVSTRLLKLSDVVLREPSTGGKDLFTRDGEYVIQARLLTRPGPLLTDPRRILRLQLGRLVRKLSQDFEFTPSAKTGLAILSYLSPADNVVKSIVLEVPNNRRNGLEGPAER